MPYLNLDLDYFDHRKTRRLIGLLGRGAEVLPIRLWAYCGKFHCEDGKLSGYSEQEIESLAFWWGKPGIMLPAMQTSEWMGRCELGIWFMHDWHQHQGHLAAFKAKGRAMAQVRWKKARDAVSIAASNAVEASQQCSNRTNPTEPTKPTVPTEAAARMVQAQTALDLSAAANLADAAAHGRVPWEKVESWLALAAKSGADYTAAEARAAWLSFEANGWMWGRNPIVDYRAAIERQIQSDRDHRGAPLSAAATTKTGEQSSSHVSGAERMQLNDELRRGEEERRRIRSSYSEHQDLRGSDRDRMKFLNRRITEIKLRLGVQI